MRSSLALLSFALACAGCGPSAPRTFPLPTADQITEMRVSTTAEPMFGGPIAEFVVPAEHVPSLLFWLVPAERYVGDFARAAEKGINPEIATVVLRTKDGTELRLRCHDWGKNPVAFTANGRDYYLGRAENERGQGIAGGVKLVNAIRDALAARK